MLNVNYWLFLFGEEDWVYPTQQHKLINTMKHPRKSQAHCHHLSKNKPNLALGREKGGSIASWLFILPIKEHGFALKGEFRDALCLRYGWRPKHLPNICICGHSFSIEHALSCRHGGFPIWRHNELRDITASLMKEVCKGVGIKPLLQPLTNEVLSLRSANREDRTRLDIVAQDFWVPSNVHFLM